MDDVDAVQATIARNMLVSGDWVTARLDGVAYLEKSPLIYWMMAASYSVLGIRDWAARLPLALASILLCWTTYRFARWAFDEESGLYAGLALATCTGLFLFTRILIPDATLTLTITVAIWSWLRLLDSDERHSLRWAILMGASLGAGLLLKGLIAIVFPLGTAVLYMALTRQVFAWTQWRRLKLGWVLVVALVIAAPWHILATLRNPPYFIFSMQSGPAQYKGFFWFYFFNEHLLRFLNLRYPRDYNTVPRALFWSLNLVWLFPWSFYLAGAPGLTYEPESRARKTRLMAICWIGMVMLFFTFSTTQEYYSMPIYPALALLIGSSMRGGSRWVKAATWGLTAMSALLSFALGALLLRVWRLEAPGDISHALTQHPELYTLSMGHILDLTLGAFAYLKLPLAIAATGFGVIAVGAFIFRRNMRRIAVTVALGMIIFINAARIALIRFDNYLGSYPLAAALEAAPPGHLIEANAYYAFSSVFFYTGRTALLWNGRYNNLEYGSWAPDVPQVFIGDQEMVSLWTGQERCYLLTYAIEIPHLEQLVGRSNLRTVKENSGNYLLTNRALP